LVEELGGRMVIEGWLIGEEAPVKERRTTGRESTTVGWVSQNWIPLDPSQTQPFCSYLDLPKCNLVEGTKAAGVHDYGRLIACKVKPAPM